MSVSPPDRLKVLCTRSRPALPTGYRWGLLFSVARPQTNVPPRRAACLARESQLSSRCCFDLPAALNHGDVHKASAGHRPAGPGPRDLSFLFCFHGRVMRRGGRVVWRCWCCCKKLSYLLGALPTLFVVKVIASTAKKMFQESCSLIRGWNHKVVFRLPPIGLPFYCFIIIILM